jgi:hypothetical protein
MTSVYCCGWFWWFVFVYNIIWLPTFTSVFFWLILVHGHTSVHCLHLPLFPCIRQSVVQGALYHVYVLFFCQYWACRYDLFHRLIKLFRACICYLFLFAIILLEDIWFVMPGFVVLLFLLCHFPSTAIRTCLLRNTLSNHTSNILAKHYFKFPSLLILLLCVECLHSVCHLSHFDWFNSSENCANVLTVEFIFGSLLPWLSIFRNSSSAYVGVSKSS